MVTRLEPIIDDVTGRFEAPKEFVLPGQNRVAAALDFARTVIRRAERVTVAATRVGWLGAGEQRRPVSQPARRSRLHALALARRRLPSLAQTVRIPMAPTFKLAAGAPKADLFVVPVFSGARLGPGAQLVDDAIDGKLAEFMQETDFDGKRGEVLAVPTGGRLAARAALLLGVGDAETFDAAAVRRAGAVLAGARLASASVATTLLDAVGRRRRPRPRRAGVRRRRVPRPLPVPPLQVGGQGVAAASA